MVEVHSKSNQQLSHTGRGLNPELPKNLDAEHQTVRNELAKGIGSVTLTLHTSRRRSRIINAPPTCSSGTSVPDRTRR